MDKNFDLFAKIPQPKNEQDHLSIQDSLIKIEENDHQMIEIEKGIEVMDAHKNDNEFILSALQERWQDYNQSIDKLKDNITTLSKLISDKTKQSEISTYDQTIQATEKAYDDFNVLWESIEMQKHRLNSIENGEALIKSKFNEVDIIGGTIYSLELNTDEALTHVMNFIQDMQTLQQNELTTNQANNSDQEEDDRPQKKQSKKKGQSKKKQPKNIKIDENTYKEKKFEIKGILSKYFKDKLVDTSSESSHSDIEATKEDHPESEKERNSSRKQSQNSEKQSQRDSNEKSKSRSRNSSRRSSSRSSKRSSNISSHHSEENSDKESESPKKSSRKSSENRSDSGEKQSKHSNIDDDNNQLSVEDLQSKIQNKNEEI